MVNGKNVVLILVKIVENGRGSKIAISKSNKRNKSATKKKRKEKGRRDDLIGSNPHS